MVKLKSPCYHSLSIHINAGWHLSKTNGSSGNLKGEEKVGDQNNSPLSCRGREGALHGTLSLRAPLGISLPPTVQQGPLKGAGAPLTCLGLRCTDGG